MVTALDECHNNLKMIMTSRGFSLGLGERLVELSIYIFLAFRDSCRALGVKKLVDNQPERRTEVWSFRGVLVGLVFSFRFLPSVFQS